MLLDNKRRTVFCDDDDWIAPRYVEALLQAAMDGPDLISFRQEATVDGVTGTIEFRLGNPNEFFDPQKLTLRNAWHICAWRRSLAILSHFPATNFAEDWAFAGPLCALPGLKEIHIPDVLHYYRHDAASTEAPAPDFPNELPNLEATEPH
ncbi:MAG: hypothetical protein NT154_16100 [Verrucomicrobia bacterium]|nr:hypothetical protein [Verrucomicrobiota bacterium]